MTFFALLITLALERLFKLSDRWKIDNLFKTIFEQISPTSKSKTFVLAGIWLVLLITLFTLLDNFFFNIPLLCAGIFIAWLCIGAHNERRYYRHYMKAASDNDKEKMLENYHHLIKITATGENVTSLSEKQYEKLQYALMWVNYSYFLAPIFLFVFFGYAGVIFLALYALLRDYRVWLYKNKPEQIKASYIETILHWVNWLPVRLVGLAYVLLGHGDQILAAEKRFFSDYTTPAYQVLSEFARIALQDTSKDDPLQTPATAVTFAHKLTLSIIVVMAIFTLYRFIF